MEKAKRASEDAWMGSVRYDHGERYQDVNVAKEVLHHCGPSSTVRPGIGAKLFNRTFFRCSLEATPCRGSATTSGDRTERRYEEETDND